MCVSQPKISTTYRNQELRALVVELVDTRDLKSLDVRVVPVQVRPGAPSKYKARWQSGYAADCKSVDLGSTPGRASILMARPYKLNQPGAGFFVFGIQGHYALRFSLHFISCSSCYFPVLTYMKYQ